MAQSITDYHAAYYAYELSKMGGDGVDRIGKALFDACVDLNPHQIEAALFALQSPISKGVLLADEVGLGKTIEAGLVICQYWAERKRSILVITPASLRKQWAIELQEKFNLHSIVLDAKTYKESKRSGNLNPFSDSKVIICSMHFASSQAEDIRQIAWDVVVIDEAHKLRNAHREKNIIGQRIRWATNERKKVLLTATPLQNSLIELYGLTTLIDERIFGDLASFRSQYVNTGGNLELLRKRLLAFCWRTLRSQVTEFVKYTERKLITRPFSPSEQEHKLYESVSGYLQRDDTYAIPSRQRHLLVLLVRKVLASSPHAVAGTLEVIRERLIKMYDEANANRSYNNSVLEAEEMDDDLLDELLSDQEDVIAGDGEFSDLDDQTEEQPIDLAKLQTEINEITDYIRWARGIGVDTKSRTLLSAIDIGFKAMQEMGAENKVVIFTESRRTQNWLKNFLESNGFAGQVLTFNGTNKDDSTGLIYREWVESNKDTGRVTGSKQIDLRTAIIERFRDNASILIATEAGSEGLNLQFCSAVINFDMPWNPQRIEQRIGRCHRYGQKHDVVVINFLNQRNAADQRVHELLDKKFKLFSGVFGASDDVLGSIEAGIDFEKKILEIYQSCRTETEIQEAFKQLQNELDEQIQARLSDTRKLLLEHFDEDVHERLKVSFAGTQEHLDRMGRMFWSLTMYALRSSAKFDDKALTFRLTISPLLVVPVGTYHLISKQQENVSGNFLYRLSHPLGEYVIDTSKKSNMPAKSVVFDISGNATRIALVEQLKGRSGLIKLQHLRIDSFDTDEYLLFSGVDDQGRNLDQETCVKMFQCSGWLTDQQFQTNDLIMKRLEANGQQYVSATINRNIEENNRHFLKASEQLDKWAEDLEIAAQRDLDDTKRRIRELQRQSRLAQTMEEQHAILEDITKLERRKRTLRNRIFEIDDEIAEKRDQLIAALKERMKQRITTTPVFTIHWSVI